VSERAWVKQPRKGPKNQCQDRFYSSLDRWRIKLFDQIYSTAQIQDLKLLL